MSRIFISYIIPCYNIQEYLPRCLESLSKQRIDSGEVEFVLVNDGSPDNCLELLTEFAKKDVRAVVVDQHNQGVSAARNTGLKAAKGEFVFFLDGDDYLTDDASQVLYDVYRKYNGDILITNAYKVKDGNWDHKMNWNTCPKLLEGLYPVEVFIKNVSILPISFKAYRRDLLVQHNILYDGDLKVGEVLTFFLNALQYSKDVCFTNKRIMNYVLRDGGAMRQINVEKDKTILTTISKMNEYASGPSFNLRKYMSYNAAFDRIVRIFTLNKYTRQSNYTTEIGSLLKVVANNESYREVLYFIAFRNSPLNLRLYAMGQLFLPTKINYTILRWLMKLSSR